MKKLITLLLVLCGGITQVSADDWSLCGDFNDWKTTANAFSDGKVELDLTVGQTISFKVVNTTKNTWYGCSTNVTYSNNSNLEFTTGGDNCYLIAGEGGTYTFTLDTSGANPKLSITYPDYTGTIYFYNNLSFTSPYLYVLTTSYWDNTKGSGSNGRPDGIAMTQIGSTGVYQAACPSNITDGEFYIAFVDGQQNGYNNFWSTKAVYRGDFKTSKAVFVPNTTSSGTHNSTTYYSNGDWHAYPSYTRSVTSGNFGTICLPFNATVTGANVYKIVSTIGTGESITGINLDPVDNLEAGKAYIFQATGSTLTATYSGSYSAATDADGMLGNLSSSATTVPEGNYVVSGNKIRKVVSGGSGVTVGQYRAYITLTDVAETQARGMYFLGFDDEGETTGVTNCKLGIMNSGQDIYDLQGRRVAQPGKGLYIVNGKKVVK